jgi:type I restriction enzyme S subunit
MLDAEKNAGVPKPYIGNKAVQWNRVDISELPSVPMSHSDIERFRLKRGDLLVCEGGEVGRAAIWDAPIEECYYQKALHRLRPLRGFNVQLMPAILHQWSSRGLLTNYVTQTSIAHLPRDRFMEVPIPLPPSPEQRAIASVLSDCDALLGGLDRLIIKKRDLKQGVVQQLLTGQTRLPGFHGEWEIQLLGNVAEIVSGGTPRTNEPSYWNGDINWCTPTDITSCRGKYLIETERSISRRGLSNSGAHLLPAGALLLCSRATIGDMRIAGREVCTNQGFKSLICRSGMNNEFLYYKLLTMKQKMIELSFGSTFLEISKRNVAALEVPKPNLPEQTAIAAVLSDIDAELAALEARRDKTRALKQAMMQELLTGKTRLV